MDGTNCSVRDQEQVNSIIPGTVPPQAGRDFGWALRQLRGGFRVARRGWNGNGQYIEMQHPDVNSKMKRPYIYISPVDGGLAPWTASQTDLLASDWIMASA